MTARTPSALKLFFETGDKPTQSQFGDVMDSYVNVVQTSGQSIISDISALGTLDVTGSAAFKANVSVSGKFSVVGNINLGTLKVSADSGNILLSSTIVSGSNGYITPTGIVGTKTNDSAAAGNVGEYISNTAAGISLSNGVPKNITSIGLTPGDWDVWGNIVFTPDASTTITFLIAAINTTSNTLPSSPGGGGYQKFFGMFPSGQENIIAAGIARISVATSTNTYLVADANFAVSAMSGSGFIGARRIR